MLKGPERQPGAGGARRPADPAPDAATRLHEVFRTSGVAMGLVGLDGEWLAVTDRLCTLLRADARALLLLTPRDLIHPDDRPAAVRATRALLDGTLTSVDTRRRYLRADGGVLGARVLTTLLRDPDGRPDSFLTQLVETDDAPEADGVPVPRGTGAPAPTAVPGLSGPDTLLAHLGRALGRSRRAGRAVVLVHVTLPESLAASPPDPRPTARLLTCAAQRLVGTVREGDLVAVWPDGRLTVCCEGLHDEDDVPRVVARLHTALAGPVEVDGVRHLLGATLSAAVAGRSETAEALLAREGWPVAPDGAAAVPRPARRAGRHRATAV